MIVLLDLEWVDNTEKRLTQLSALRVDPAWTVVSRFDALVRPGPKGITDPMHMAYGGYAPAQLEAGLEPAQCIRRLAAWLQPDDVIWTWAGSNQAYLHCLWQLTLSDPVPVIRSQADTARRIAAGIGITVRDPYRMLAKAGIAVPAPAHRSANDVEVMRLLFEFLAMPDTDRVRAPARVLSPAERRGRNADTIARTQYNYLYVPGSPVFHRRDCKLVLGAKSILGARHYATAARAHRPCRVCRPVAGLDLAPALETHRPAAAPDPRPQPEAYGSAAEFARDPALYALREKQPYKPLPPADDRIVPVKTAGGQSVQIRKNNIIGWCHFGPHRGAVTKALLKQRDCVKKGCRYFERSETSTYWAAQKVKAEEKTAARREKQEQKQKAAALAVKLQSTQTEWQTILNELDSDMLIVRLEAPTPTLYTIFYVSDNPFADGNRFPAFLDFLRRQHPGLGIRLRHIQDMSGHFVTRAEYHARPRR